MTNVKFSIDEGEKVGVVGRNGIGKSTLFGILTGADTDFTGEVIFKRGTTVVATAQEHSRVGDQTVLQYILAGLPEYKKLSHVIETYPETMGDNMKLINEYTEALERFEQKGFYQIEEKVERELNNFQLPGTAYQSFASLSGGQKRLAEVIKVMHSNAHLALIDEPTNHMDYVAKQQFIDWMKSAQEAMLVITHDRDVLKEVDRIVELKDGGSVSYRGNYDAYLKQNAARTNTGMSDFEMVEKRIVNLKQKVVDYKRLKEKSRNPQTIQKFKRLENTSREELAKLQEIEKPTFWIDKESAAELDFKSASRYQRFKTKNIRMNLKNDESRSKHQLVTARNLSLGYESPLFSGVNIDLREGEAVELRGRNGAGKSTLIKKLLGEPVSTAASFSVIRTASQSEHASSETRAAYTSKDEPSKGFSTEISLFEGEVSLDPQTRVGVYEQEVSPTLFDLTLHEAIETIYLERRLSISETKIRQLMSDYLFSEGDGQVPVGKLSGGQKARLQIIEMLSNDPQLLVLDEPTNHLDLPSIEELETALEKYSGAILYVSHDGYFRNAIGGDVITIGV